MCIRDSHQAECRVLRQPLGTARRVLLAELRQRMERRENGRIYAQLGHRHRAGAGAAAGRCPSRRLLPVPLPLQGAQGTEHPVYGGPVHQRELHRLSLIHI